MSTRRVARSPSPRARRLGASPDPAAPPAPRPCPVIRAAASEVAANWRADAAEVGDALEVDDLVAALVDAIEASAQGRPLDVDPKLVSVSGRRLLQLLRAETLDGWPRHAPDPGDAYWLLQLMHAFESVREAIEPDWARHFTSRLAGPGGLELLIEVAHDLRSPLTSILFLAEMLQRGHSGDVNALQHRQLGLIYSAALGLSSLVSDAIELARDGNRLVEKEPATFSVTEAFESVLDVVRPIAEEKGLAVRCQPPAHDRRRGHPLALSRVLLNLTTNALKFTDEGFVELVAEPTAPGRLEFSVRDSGRGIDAEARMHLYQPFRRTTDGSRYTFSGTGLGLAICRRLVHAMGSQLHVETRKQWGTRFFFELELPLA